MQVKEKPEDTVDTPAIWDIIIMGGGLAGSCIALQLKQKLPHYKIVVVNKNKYPLTLGTGPVGESTVEIGSHYFANVLGIKKHLEEDQLPKLGLRYFLEAENVDKIENRLEVGTNRYSHTKSYQLDRAKIENHLLSEFVALGGTLIDDAPVKNVDVTAESKKVVYYKDSSFHELTSKWLVDASGRTKILRKKLNLAVKSGHTCSAVWWRLKGEHKLDDWSEDKEWRSRNGEDNARWFSTNHLMGRGYWAWLIPLSCNVTSFGLVFESEIHPYDTLNTYEKTLAWLEIHEPQLAKYCKDHHDAYQDFGTLKHYSYSSTKVYSGDGWFLTGEAGAFLDPLYSPGSDFIAISNSYITDLIYRESIGENIKLRTDIYNTLYLKLFNSTLHIYKGTYHILGNPQVLPMKIFWDWTFYWNFLARLFFDDKLCDLQFIQSNSQYFSEAERLGVEMQKILSEWSSQSRPASVAGFLDLARHPYLRSLNKALTEPDPSLSPEDRFRKGVDDLKSISNELKKLAYKEAGVGSPESFESIDSVGSFFYRDLKEFLVTA